jgi:hypothetical protein
MLRGARVWNSQQPHGSAASFTHWLQHTAARCADARRWRACLAMLSTHVGGAAPPPPPAFAKHRHPWQTLLHQTQLTHPQPRPSGCARPRRRQRRRLRRTGQSARGRTRRSLQRCVGVWVWVRGCVLSAPTAERTDRGLAYPGTSCASLTVMCEMTQWLQLVPLKAMAALCMCHHRHRRQSSSGAASTMERLTKETDTNIVQVNSDVSAKKNLVRVQQPQRAGGQRHSVRVRISNLRPSTPRAATANATCLPVLRAVLWCCCCCCCCCCHRWWTCWSST